MDLLRFGYRFRVLIAILSAGWALFSVIYIWFFMQPWYKASVKFFPPESSSGFSLASLAGISIPSTGGSSIKPEQIQEIFNSDTLTWQLVKEFHLVEKYNLHKERFAKEKSIQEFHARVKLNSNQSSAIGISDVNSLELVVEDESPDSAFLICKRSYDVLDSAVREISVLISKRKAAFYKLQIDSAEDAVVKSAKDFTAYQKRTKIFDLDRQSSILASSVGDLAKNINTESAQLNLLKLALGENSQEFKLAQAKNQESRKLLQRLLWDSTPGSLPSLATSLNASAEYERQYREIRGQIEVIKVLKQQYEIERIEAEKNYSSFRISDPPTYSKKKFKPKRIYVIPATVLAGWFAIFGVAIAGYALSISNRYFRNLIQKIASET